MHSIDEITVRYSEYGYLAKVCSHSCVTSILRRDEAESGRWEVGPKKCGIWEVGLKNRIGGRWEVEWWEMDFQNGRTWEFGPAYMVGWFPK